MPQSRTLAAIVVAALALAAPAAAAAPRSLSVRFPRTVVEPGRNVERCVFVRVPAGEPFDLGSWQVRQSGARGGVAIAHFLVYLYTGERAAEFTPGRVVESRGCLDLGPPDRDQRQLVASTNSPNAGGVLPDGLALPLAPVPPSPGAPPDAIGLVLDANWVNGTDRPRAVSARLVLTRASPGSVRRRLRPILARDADAGIAVPPFGVAATEARWRPPGDVCLHSITGKTHRRGRFLSVEARDAADRPRPPLDWVRDAFTGAPTLFGTADYTDPGVRRFVPVGLALSAGESLRYACWHDNGDRVPMRLGCADAPDATPGSAGAPAAPCRPGCACVPATLVAGPSPDDELCALAGFYYDPAPGGSCDPTAAPPLEP